MLGHHVVTYARHFVGIPYSWGGSTPRTGFDCSGLVRFVYGHFGIRLPHSSWADLSHAVRVIAVTAAGIALYEWLGFLATMSLLLFSLIFIVERKPLLPALAFSVGVTVFAYVLFATLLKSPLPRGLLGF